MFFFFFFKQKTAYEMRISDWSSDVCSSDLLFIAITERRPLALWQRHRTLALVDEDGVVITDRRLGRFATLPIVIGDGAPERAKEIGRASCRERVCQYV